MVVDMQQTGRKLGILPFFEVWAFLMNTFDILNLLQFMFSYFYILQII
jgi:hypothetical protein